MYEPASRTGASAACCRASLLALMPDREARAAPSPSKNTKDTSAACCSSLPSDIAAAAAARPRTCCRALFAQVLLDKYCLRRVPSPQAGVPVQACKCRGCWMSVATTRALWGPGPLPRAGGSACGPPPHRAWCCGCSTGPGAALQRKRPCSVETGASGASRHAQHAAPSPDL